jgi:membrane associated rhomboid family serine protease
MFPYRDENETQRTPYITMLIIAVNVLVWIFIQGAGMDYSVAASVCDHGLIAAELTQSEPPGSSFPMGNNLVCLTDPGRQIQNVFTSMFLHGSWMHLIGNMWFFWIFGNNIEDSMGHTRFIIFYLMCGVAAALLQVFITPTSLVPMVGASGAISGVMGAYLILYPNVRVYALLPLFVFFTTVALPAWMMLGYWMLLQFVGGLSASKATGGTAFWAHIGGFAAGVILIKFFARRDYINAHRSQWRPRKLGWNRSVDDDQW